MTYYNADSAIELKLSAEKTVSISPWMGKTKKDFVKIFRKKGENITEDDILDTLVIPYINNNEQYYSPDEIKYILFNLRIMSTGDDVEFTINCNNCDKEIIINTTLDKTFTYRPASFPFEANGIKWREINKGSIESISAKYPDELAKDIELMLHVEEYAGVKIKNFEQILNISDNLSIKDSNELAQTFIDNESRVTIGSKVLCPSCNVESDYIFDKIPSFFEPLLPRKVDD